MAQFSWNDSYAVGDSLIDSQHQYLFALANDLVESKGKTELTNNVMKLFRYVREHFDYEEAVMRQAGYSGYQEHVALHEALLTQLSTISSDIGKDQWSVAAVEHFMNKWLLGHILEVDIRLGAFLQRG